MSIKYIKRSSCREDSIIELQKGLKCSAFLAELLALRGLTDIEDAKRFLNPSIDDFCDPFTLKGMREAADRIKHAIEKKERIVIYGDYDCDGVSAVAILYRYLADFTEVFYYIPKRSEGYGVRQEALDKIAEEYFPDLLITVDCGITACEEVEYCKEVLGFDVIITDHHTCPEVLPDAIIVNPMISGYPTPLCGAGVALKLVEACGGGQEAEKYLDIAALATIGDVVPLVAENRVITALGLAKINSGLACHGIKQMLKLVRLDSINSYDAAFAIVPRINAAGRMGLAARAVELLTSSDYFNIDCILTELNEDNQKRQVVLADMLADAYQKLKDYDLVNKRCIVLYDVRWEGGVLGIAAGKLAVEFMRPVILFTKTDDVLKGSVRSVEGLNIMQALGECKQLFAAFGGHAQAAGISMEQKNFCEFERQICSILDSYDKSLFLPKVVYDIELDILPNKDEVGEISRLEPFGEGNPRPKFLLRTRAMDFCRIKEYSHIKDKSQGFEIVGFNKLNDLAILNSAVQKVLALNIENSLFNNIWTTKAVLDAFYADGFAGLEVEYFLESYLSAKNREYLSCASQQNEKASGQNAHGHDEPQQADSKPKEMQILDKNNICDIIKNTHDVYGTVFVAYSEQSASEFLEQFAKCGKLLILNYFNLDSKNPYNRLVIAPQSIDFGYYRRVVFIDKPFFADFGSGGASEAKAGTAKAKVAAEAREDSQRAMGAGHLIDYIKALNLTEVDMRGIFIKVRDILKVGALATSGMDLYHKINKLDEAAGRESVDYGVFITAYSVFMELGFLEISLDGNIVLSDKKARLEESRIYVCLKGAMKNEK